jgi:uncharacterized membrane protein
VRSAAGKITTFDPIGSVDTQAYAINDSGEIAGVYETTSQTRGFVGSPKSGFASIHAPNASDTEAYGINDKGAVAGYYGHKSGMHTHGFIRTP